MYDVHSMIGLPPLSSLLLLFEKKVVDHNAMFLVQSSINQPLRFCCAHLIYFIISPLCFCNLAATMIVDAEVSMTRRLDFNDVHSDVESIAPIIPARECTAP